MVIHNPCFKLLKQCLCHAASGRAVAFGWLLMEQNYLNWENHTLFHNISVKENYGPPPSWESEPIVPLVSIISCEMVSWSKSALITPSFSLSLASSLVFSSAAGEPLQITNHQKLRTLNIFPDVSFQCFRSCTGSLKSHTNVKSWHWSSQRRWQGEPDRGDTTLAALIWLTHPIKIYLEKPMNWSEIPCLKNATSNIFRHQSRPM